MNEIENLIVAASTGEDKIIFIDRKSLNIISEIKLDPFGRKCSTHNYYGPHGIKTDINKNYIYVANSYNGSISVIDIIRNSVIENIGVGTSPCHLDICKKNNMLYVSNFDSDTVSVIDLTTNAIVMQIPVNRMPHDVKCGKNGKYIYISESGSEEVAVLETEENVISQKIMLGCSPSHIEIGKNRNHLYIACSRFEKENRGEICIINSEDNKIVEKYQVGLYLTDLSVREKENQIFALDSEMNYIYIIDLNSGKMLSKTETGEFPVCIEIDEVNELVMIGTHMNSLIETYDLNDLKRINRIRAGKDLNHFLIK